MCDIMPIDHWHGNLLSLNTTVNNIKKNVKFGSMRIQEQLICLNGLVWIGFQVDIHNLNRLI